MPDTESESKLKDWVRRQIGLPKTGESVKITLSSERTKLKSVDFMHEFRKTTHFVERDDDLVVLEDPVGLIRRLPDGKEEAYMDKLAAERTKGVNEAVSYGVGKFGKHEAAMVLLNWQFMGGTSGVVAGEKIMRATDYATEHNLPLIFIGDSGGQRQQEGVAALREMPRSVHFLNQYKKNTRKPLIFVAVANMWGGLTASVVPMADEVIGMANADLGFAGPGVMESYEGKLPPKGSQSVENRFATNRSVHVIPNNMQELVNHVEKHLDVVSKIDQLPKKSTDPKEITGIYFDHPVGEYHSPGRPRFQLRSQLRAKIPTMSRDIKAETVWDQHQVLSSDPRRPDTTYLLQHAFDGFVPLYAGKIEEDEQGKHLRYPSIVAALAYIDDPRAQKSIVRMIIGNQPGYLKLDDGRIVKEHASPTAEDFQYQRDMVSYAQRLGLSITTFVDTFGAMPTLLNDRNAQYKSISQCLKDQMDFPYFTSGYLIGIGGSGGHIATDFTGDYAAMLSGAQEFVAEPKSGAAILHKEPTYEDWKRTTEGMQPTADFLLSRGLIDHIIREPYGGAQNHPYSVARAIREDMIRVELDFGTMSTEDIMMRRDQRLRNLRSIPINHLGNVT